MQPYPAQLSTNKKVFPIVLSTFRHLSPVLDSDIYIKSREISMLNIENSYHFVEKLIPIGR